jgi:hypothetical protein
MGVLESFVTGEESPEDWLSGANILHHDKADYEKLDKQTLQKMAKDRNIEIYGHESIGHLIVLLRRYDRSCKREVSLLQDKPRDSAGVFGVSALKRLSNDIVYFGTLAKAGISASSLFEDFMYLNFVEWLELNGPQRLPKEKISRLLKRSLDKFFIELRRIEADFDARNPVKLLYLFRKVMRDHSFEQRTQKSLDCDPTGIIFKPWNFSINLQRMKIPYSISFSYLQSFITVSILVFFIEVI